MVIETEFPVQPKGPQPSPQAFPTATPSTFIRLPSSEGSELPPLHQRKRKPTQLQDDIVKESLSGPDQPVEDSMPAPHASNTFPLASPEDIPTRSHRIHERGAQPPTQKLKKNIMDWRVRKQVLEEDPLIDAVEKKRVHCKICDKWIRLDGRNDYYPGLWNKHREHHKESCITEGGSRRNRHDEEHLLENTAEQLARQRGAVESNHPKHPHKKSRT